MSAVRAMMQPAERLSAGSVFLVINWKARQLATRAIWIKIGHNPIEKVMIMIIGMKLSSYNTAGRKNNNHRSGSSLLFPIIYKWIVDVAARYRQSNADLGSCKHKS
jgi:hypothetical protein